MILRMIGGFMLGLCADALISVPASAQVCAGGYARDERAEVMSLANRFDVRLARLAELAELGANGVFSVKQRAQLQEEFDALRAGFDAAGDRGQRRRSPRANEFLAAVVDSEYLGISNATLLGSSIEEGQRHSREALDALNNARVQMQVCFFGSWDRISIDPSVNDGSCGGGVARPDRDEVRRAARRLSSILNALESLGETVAYQGVFGTARQLARFEYEYLLEDIELLSERTLGRVSARSRGFVRSVIDPGYLALLDESVSGATIEEDQRRARALLEALVLARSVFAQCQYR
jgi:hypothetical protein